MMPQQTHLLLSLEEKLADCRVTAVLLEHRVNYIPLELYLNLDYLQPKKVDA